MVKQLSLFDPEPTNGSQSGTPSLSVAHANEQKVAHPEQKEKEGSTTAFEKKNEQKNGDIQKKGHCTAHWKLFVDGAARNNPGPAGAGFYLLKDGEMFAKKGYYLGSRTNNQAEYLALLLGLHFLKHEVKPGDCVHIISDSQLLVRQLQGQYKIKAVELKPLHALASALMHVLHAEIFHVLRTDNVHADRMANKGIDTQRAVPHDFITMLHAHGISW
jgi:ribonuclease HI